MPASRYNVTSVITIHLTRWHATQGRGQAHPYPIWLEDVAEQVKPCHIIYLLHARKGCLLSYATRLRHGGWHLAPPASVLQGCCCLFPAPLINVSPGTPLLRVGFLSTETSETMETMETSKTIVVTQGHPAWKDRIPIPQMGCPVWGAGNPFPPDGEIHMVVSHDYHETNSQFAGKLFPTLECVSFFARGVLN